MKKGLIIAALLVSNMAFAQQSAPKPSAVASAMSQIMKKGLGGQETADLLRPILVGSTNYEVFVMITSVSCEKSAKVKGGQDCTINILDRDRNGDSESSYEVRYTTDTKGNVTSASSALIAG